MPPLGQRVRGVQPEEDSGTAAWARAGVGDTLGREVTAGQGQVSRDQQGLVMRELIRHLVHVVSCQAPRGGGEEAAAPAWSSHTVSFMEI